MASADDNNAGGGGDFNVMTQVFTLLGPDGVTEYPVAVNDVDKMYVDRFAAEAIYGTQVGATVLMLVVYLLMMPRPKLVRVPTIINVLAMLVNIVRTVLLIWFPSSMWFEFYTLWTGDVSHVPASDFRTSVAATVMTIPLLVLIEIALMVQAWAMIQLWPAMYRWPAMLVSGLIACAAVSLKFVDSIQQSHMVFDGNYIAPRWVRERDLVFSTLSIFWFCFLFNVRLAVHMFKHRSILPSIKGMSAMEVLVTTNGVLMCVPALFAGFEWGSWTAFEIGSLTYTSVIIVLPLGTLVAQRIANPSAFSHSDEHNSNPSSSSGRNEPFLKSWHSTTVSSKVESNCSNGGHRQGSVVQHDPDGGYAKYGSVGDVEQAYVQGVRVARRIEHYEERDV